jgi:general secretion pathway protein J
MTRAIAKTTRTRRCGVRRRGFTLLEILIALAMTVVLAGSLYASLRIAFKGRDSVTAAVEPSRTAELALAIIRRDLESALPPKGQLAAEFIGTVAQDNTGAESDNVSFYGNAPAPLHVSGSGEINKIELGVIQDTNNDHVLVRRLTSNLLSTVQSDYQDQEVICRGVAGFTMKYYDGTEWLDEWDSTQENDTLPVAIEVTLDLQRPAQPPGSGQMLLLHFRRVLRMPCAVPVYTDGSDTGDTGTTPTAPPSN